MKVIKILFCLSILFLFIECGKRANNETISFRPSKTSPIFNATLKKLRTFQLNEHTYKVGRLHGMYEPSFTDKFGNLYIHDSKNYVYVKIDSTGNFLGILGQKGRGPGEYIEPSYGTTDKDGNIFIFDISKFVTLKYDDQGHFIKEFSYRLGVPAPGELFIEDSIRIITLYDFKGSNYFENVNLFHILDKNFNIIKSININYPSIYDKFHLENFIQPHFVAFKRYVFVNFTALPYIYQYDFDGLLLNRFGIKPENFKIINKPVSPNRDILKLEKFLSQFSRSYSFFIFKKKFLFYIYYNESLPEVGHFKLFDLERYRTYFFVLYSINGNIIPVDSNQLPGMPITFDKKGRVYVLLNNRPDHREIGVYQIEIQKK